MGPEVQAVEKANRGGIRNVGLAQANPLCLRNGGLSEPSPGKLHITGNRLRSN